jgi:flagellar hook-length control protein FliK
MNVTASAHAASSTTGAHAKPGKGGDPLADFMALLGQLGITVDGDGTITEGGTTTTAAGPNDLAAKLIAKLAKKVEGATDEKGETPTEGEAAGDDSKQTSLTDLLATIAPATTDAAPQKLDVASLLAAVRAFAAANANPDKAPADTTETRAISAAGSQASSIAALLARTTRGTGTAPATPAPGAVQSAFNQLEAQMAGSAEATSTSVKAEEKQPATKDSAKSDAAASDKATTQPQNAAITKLTELLARMTASSKPGAAQPPLPAVAAQAAANAAQPQIDPQLAALAQAMQQAGKDDKPTQATPDTSAATTATLGIAPVSTPAPAAKADATQMVATPAPADQMISHHLDLAKDSQWLDSLARDIARAANSESHMRFQLSPEHLGTLKVELLNGSNGTSVKLTTETEAARQILADAQPKLVAEARAQGLRISEAQVNLGNHGGGQRHMAEQQPVVIRTASGSSIAEVEQDRPATSGERYA